jgi:UDP-N-acetylmuramate--alanine ligase
MVDRTQFALPGPPARIHFIGIGGIGMSGLARVLHGRGYHVSGSDAHENDQTRSLRDEGVAVAIGHNDLQNVRSADLVVLTSAVSGGNPELTAARSASKTILKRAELLGIMSAKKKSIAVAGSHGKSTTCGILVTALAELGQRPSYFVGAVVSNIGTNAHWDEGEHIVVEADEYDHSFLALNPDLAIITNIDFDHPDLFDQDSYDRAFLHFARRVKPKGTLIVRGDDPGALRLLESIGPTYSPKIVTFGEATDLDWTAAQRKQEWEGGTPSDLPLPGTHNAFNLAAAVAALVSLGFSKEESGKAVSTFKGVGRRFELIGEAEGVTVIDDYAHHPTEIRATLAAARDRYPGRRLWAIFQPHTYTRTRALLPKFAEALQGADEVVILEIYAAREANDGTVSSRDLQHLVGDRSVVIESPRDVAAEIIGGLHPGDVVITMGAGDVTTAGPLILAALQGGTTT